MAKKNKGNAPKNAKKETVKTPVVTTTKEAPIPATETVTVEVETEKKEKVETVPVEKPIVKGEKEPVTVVKEATAAFTPPVVEKAVEASKVKGKPIKQVKEAEKVKEVVETVEVEVVDDTKPKTKLETKSEKAPAVPAKEMAIVSLGEGLYSIAKNNEDRLNRNSAITMLNLFKTEFIDDTSLTKEQHIALRKQYRGVLLAEMLCYSTQVHQDLQSFGALVTKDVFNVLEKEAQELFGIKLLGFENPKNKEQMVIDFDKSEIPTEVKAAAVADNKVKDLEIPEADPKMSDENKIEAIRILMSQKLGMGGNLVSTIDWCKKAFAMEDARPAQIVAAIFELLKNTDVLCLNGIERAIYGKFGSEHSILSSHALLKGWLPTVSDKDVADLVKVFLARHAEKLVSIFNASNNNNNATFEGEFLIRNNKIQAGLSKAVLDGIFNKTSVVTEKGELANGILIDGAKCYKSLISTYGDSDSIIKDKVAEIVKYYAKPIDRLANYKDESAYSEVTAK